MKPHTRSRREFVGLTGAGLAGLASAPWLDRSAGAAQAAAADTQDVDLVVFNAKVYTVDAGMPRAEAFAVRRDASWPSGPASRCGRSPARTARPSTPGR